MSRKRAVDPCRACEDQNMVELFYPLYVPLTKFDDTSTMVSYLSHTKVLFWSLFSFISKQGVTVTRSARAQHMVDLRARNWDATDENQVNYILMVIILNSFIQLFAPFTALCPNLNPTSFDIATSQKRRNVKWIRVLIWTQSGKWDK